jgi:type II secretory pathway pseudopilin PulG
MKKTQNGFSVIEGLLIVVIVSMLAAVGWYVWHSQKQVDKTYSQTANSSAVTKSKTSTILSPTDNTKYFVIKEWGVRAKYDGKLTLNYAPPKDSTYAVFSSNQLADAANGGCKDFGGRIDRVKTGEVFDSDIEGRPVEQMVKDPQTSFVYKNIGNYYYLFLHDQSLCSDIKDPNSQAAILQNQTNDAVKSLVENLEAIPAQ